MLLATVDGAKNNPSINLDFVVKASLFLEVTASKEVQGAVEKGAGDPWQAYSHDCATNELQHTETQAKRLGDFFLSCTCCLLVYLPVFLHANRQILCVKLLKTVCLTALLGYFGSNLHQTS